MYKDFQRLAISQAGRVLTIALNAPEKRNAIDAQMHLELERAIPVAAEDPSVGVIVLTGAGQSFSAGGDIPKMQEKIDDPRLFYPLLIRAKRLVFTMLDCPTPIISRVNGDAMGLGATLALLADVIIADENARFADPHVKVGFVAGDGGAFLWPMLIGYARAKQYLLSGDMLSAREAAEIGLINFAVATEELDPLVAKWARKLGEGAQRSVNWTKMTINIGLRQMATAVMDAGMAYEALSNATADHSEAVAAFMEKRKPHFTGN